MNSQLPVPHFDTAFYHKLCSRLGRQRKLLQNKQHGSVAYQRLYESLKRTETMIKKFLVAYFKELAIYAVQKDIPPSLPALHADGVLKEQRLYTIVKENWGSYLNQQQRIRLRFKEYT